MAKIPYFNPWMLSNPTLPKLYWDVKSPEQLIANLYCIIEGLRGHLDDETTQVNENTENVDDLLEFMEQVKNGQWTEGYIDSLAKWIDDNLQAIVARQAAYAFPTLWQDPEDGTCHFAMVVPETWDFLDFLWIFDESDNTYHIALKY